ncbi:efflux RND transporter permease subunit [Desulfobacca acetoxidans]|uniref:Transporter, hydrophobe/amphiphile efflux-1 (HAE1) family n=1 Tax=Desulfobacca acetoxidans (strain ATCC 700848 / DSM 11109 / ASRB2) TaxID=880072 RepID=F2NCV1_DESAR|nr:efflux RND transporter permease subunit [Desulfobacca acetoxidans]AEB09382.1 transporter, hydrophobe/amphiphile efflux-1 (HAE1) family [Desulfobacca acetoxidans DSM 11109]
MLSNFFLDRPVFAWVIAIIMMLAGGLAIYNMPISQYPPIAPPSIAIDAFYPGASAETVENSVVQIIEQKMTGFDKLLYMSGTSDASGAGRIELTFAPGADPDLAWAMVQNKLQLAMASLPDTVQRSGVKVSKSTKNWLIIVGLTSEDGSMDEFDLADYAQANIEQVLARVPGVGEVETFTSQYAMRVWVNPDKLNDYQLTMEDVIKGLQAYNVEVSAGQFGGIPAVEGQRLNASIIVQNLLKTPEEFAAIPLRINPDGSIVRVRDVGRTELGTERYGSKVLYNGQPGAALAIRQAAGANALKTADGVKAKMAELAKYFPPGMKAMYPYDTTPFVRVAINEVVWTLFEAILLVFLVMYVFLGNLRATLIPTLAVPVVILGTFAILGLFGFSINMLTMFAMVLAIGLLVDDAIVVVENVERVMSEEGLPPKEATRKSMGEITSALIGIGLVLAAVFGPMAFFGGSTGVIYRQFSITVIAAMLLSVVVALILTPVLCASLLKPVAKGHQGGETGFRFFRPFFRWFDQAFLWTRDRYQAMVGQILGKKLRYVVIYLLIVATLGFLFQRMPTAYLPNEDQGVMFVQTMLPAGSTLEQTQQIQDQVRTHFLEDEKDAVASIFTVAGRGFSGAGQNTGLAFVKLRDWELRPGADLKVDALVKRAMAKFSKFRNALVFAFPPPAVLELGRAGGFDFQLQDRGGLGHEALMKARNQMLGMAAQDPRLVRVRPSGLEDVTQYRIDVDWEKAGALGVPISAIHHTISAAFGSAYVNDFIQGGRVKRVYAQADSPYRMLPKDLERLYVRNAAGTMTPFTSFATGHWFQGSPLLERYNSFPSLNIWGEPAPGRSSGEAMQAMEEIVAKLPKGVGYDWTGISYQERMAKAQTGLLYTFSIIVIFLCLAALYESWTIPITILLALPLGVVGGVVASSLRGLPNDVYFQIGLLTVLGLTTKNAILIVQFAMAKIEEGMGLVEATLEGSKLRLRPIVMTSLAFGFGVLPLALATGAGAGAQMAIGTGVLGGMITATFLAIFFIPLFFVGVVQLFGKKKTHAPTGEPDPKVVTPSETH